MISPEYYQDTIKDYNLDELIKERESLLQEIRRFEGNEISLEERMISPFPEVIYQCNNEYLIQVIKLINQKFNLSLYDEEDEE